MAKGLAAALAALTGLLLIPAGALLLFLRFARLFAEYWTHRRDFGTEPSH